MAIFLFSSVETCEGGRDLCHHFLEKIWSTLLVQRRKGQVVIDYLLEKRSFVLLVLRRRG